MVKYCQNCGTENNEESKFCASCGSPMDGNTQTTDTKTSKKLNTMALAGFVTALISLILNFFGIVGIIATILSCLGYSQTNPGEKDRTMAIAGIIIGVISILYGAVMILSA